MKIGVVQLRPVSGNIPANIAAHTKLLQLAIDARAGAVFFPELSLTGYEPRLAKQLATTINDPRFDCFQSLSDANNLAIGLGMPLRDEEGISIGLLIFHPGRQRLAYRKQLLHADELPYFIPGRQQVILPINGKCIAPAICYESLQEEHAAEANRLGADVYLASVAKSATGVEKASKHFPAIARKYAMPVLMANSIGACDNFISAGGSAVWNSKGILLAQLDDQSEGLLLFDTESEEVEIRTI